VNEQELAQLAKRDLEPLLAVKATIAASKVKRLKKGGRHPPGNNLWVSVPGPGKLEVSLRRSLPVSVWEAAILQPYGAALADLSGVPDSIARHAADDVIVRAIAGQIGGDRVATVELVIRFLVRCAGSTYEGQPVHLNLLVDLDLATDTPAFDNLDVFQTRDWYAVLGSGVDTGVLVDSSGGVTRVVDVRGEPATAGIEQIHPDALRDLAAWTSTGNRVALSLSRNREIAIQQHGALRYVFRSGRWRAFPVEVAISSSWSSGSGVGKSLKRAVLASAIDASLGHHGACIAVVTKGQARRFRESEIVRAEDRWPANVRSQLFSTESFAELTRRQRVELLSMDGATVMDHTGKILAAGAIVAVPGGSTGGGRLAATKALAEYGAALKVSQDGPIALYGLDANGLVTEKMAFA